MLPTRMVIDRWVWLKSACLRADPDIAVLGCCPNCFNPRGVPTVGRCVHSFPRSPMRQETIPYCALTYLNLWLSHDRQFHSALINGTDDEKLAALAKAASVYGVARNAPRSGDIDRGMPRFRPVLLCLQSCSSASITPENMVAAVTDMNQSLSRSYGRRCLTSLTSKFLWGLVRSPVVIYDANAINALGAPLDYAGYVNCWQDSYRRHRVSIGTACDDLPSVKRYVVDPDITATDIAALAKQEWFCERVFDIWLWHEGALA